MKIEAVPVLHGFGLRVVGEIKYIGSAIKKEWAERIANSVNNNHELIATLEEELEALLCWMKDTLLDNNIRKGMSISADKIERALAIAKGEDHGS